MSAHEINLRWTPAPGSPWRLLEEPATLTLLFADDRHPARKEFTVVETAAGRRIDVEGYGKAGVYQHQSLAIADIEALADTLTRLESRNVFAIRGTIQPAAAGRLCNRRLKKSADADVRDTPSKILCIDIDNAVAPEGLDITDPLEVGEYCRGRLPEELRDVSCVVQLSNSHGLPGKRNAIKCHLWFLLQSPLASDPLRRWMKAVNQTAADEGRLTMDPTVCTPNQPLYFGAPLFNGMADPLPQRIALLLGLAGDVATIQPPPAIERPAVEPPADGAARHDPAVLRPLVASIRHAADNGLPRHPAILAAAYTAGGYVAGGAVTMDEARAALLAAALASGSPGADRTVEDSLRAGLARPLYAEPEATDEATDADPLGEKSDFAADLSRLRNSTPASAGKTAQRIVARYAWQSPRRRTFAELAETVAAHLPTGAGADLADRLRRQAAWLERQARRRAGASTALDSGALANAGVRLEPVQTLAGLEARIAAEPEAIWLVKAPHGAGKTESVLKPLAGHPDCTVAICNRVSLVADLCQRLNLANYQSLKPGEMPSVTALGLCLPSLVNPKFNDVLGRCERLLVDEISACLREVHTPNGGTLKRNGPEATRRLALLLEQSRVACGVDADLSTRDVLTLAQLVKRPIRVVELLPTPTGIEVEFADADVTKANILAALEAGQKIRVACDSSRAVVELAALIRARWPELNVMAIHSRSGDSTAGDPATLRLLADVNANIHEVDVLIHSPTVESGVSLTVPHFHRTFGLFSGRSVSPAGFIQQLRRDRTATRLEVGFAGACRDGLPTNGGDILLKLEETHRRSVQLDADEGGYTMRVEPATPWDKRVVEYRAQRNIDMNDAAANLLLLLEARGMTVRAVAGEALDKAEVQQARILAESEYQQRVMEVNRLTDDERAVLETAYQPTPAESAALERYDAAAACGQDAADLTSDDLATYAHGKLSRWNQRFDRLTATLGAGLDVDRADSDAGTPLTLRRHESALTEAIQHLFEVAGMDRLTGAGTLDAAAVVEAYQNFQASPCRPALESAGVVRFDRPLKPTGAVRWFGGVLSQFGLALTRCGPGQYCIDADEQRTGDGLRVKAPGWRAMRAMQQRRQRRQKEEKDYRAPASCDVTHADNIEQRPPLVWT